MQIKFAGFAVITTDAVRWMKNIIQDLPCVEVGAGHGLITREPTTWGMLPAMRYGVIAKRLTSTLHQSVGACTEREKNQLIDELSIRDQRLQQVDTIMAELQDKMYSVKTKHHPPERPAKRGAICVIKLVMDNRILGQAIDQSEAGTEDSPTTNRQPQIANHKSSRPNPATATTTSC